MRINRGESVGGNEDEGKVSKEYAYVLLKKKKTKMKEKEA